MPLRPNKDRFKAETGLRILDLKAHRTQLKKLALDQDMMEEVRVIGSKHPNIAIYHTFPLCLTASTLIRKMGPISHFKWDTSQTMGSFSKGVSRQAWAPDAKMGLRSKIVPSKSTFRSKEQRPKQSQAALKKLAKVARGNNPIVRDPGRRGLRPMRYHPEPKHYLQHAWCRAVENDATFIIFQCAKYERIGFRHRETQTLYLSELIDPSVLPTYGKMEIGLQIAIVKDLIERRAATKEKEKETDLSNAAKKRPAEDNESSDSIKRQKTGKKYDAAVPSAEVIDSGLGARDLALLRLEYPPFNSTVPSSFIRVEPSCAPSMKDRILQEIKGRKKYSPSEYFTLTLTEPFATGAIGTVHRASARFQFHSTTIEYPELAVKFAFHEEHQEQLRHEYKVYRHMASVGFTMNILRVHGLFQDSYTDLINR
ncbi:hypothetical protein M413DRAFT_28111 [Hebeloma cylindrosporum]|uniref:Uncharacterized protein n=1 Tax=Hebeloma cylindrosporum TaxID=76867 RepID=A0A0C3C9W1_HEBCY|nr:hypothetical protein M413DRAFT_28111 [Hebeloma cylindrosporum h7]